MKGRSGVALTHFSSNSIHGTGALQHFWGHCGWPNHCIHPQRSTSFELGRAKDLQSLSCLCVNSKPRIWWLVHVAHTPVQLCLSSLRLTLAR
jgi:hypothetical protein